MIGHNFPSPTVGAHLARLQLASALPLRAPCGFVRGRMREGERKEEGGGEERKQTSMNNMCSTLHM